MSLYIKNINDICFDDVINFCNQGITEGINLDYKLKITDQLEKTISSFANSSGGLIIIGIEDEDSKPKLPFIGIDHIEGIEERIWSILLDNIYPPVFPEIKVCEPVNGKTFIIIRVQESNETPHAIHNNKSIYIRTGNITKLEDRATVKQIEWLFNNRKKSEDFRESLKVRANNRSDNLAGGVNTSDSVTYTISCYPLYPSKALVNSEVLKEIINNNNIKIRKYLSETGYDMHRNQDGIYFFIKEISSNHYDYLEINKFGLLYNKRNDRIKNKELNIYRVFDSLIRFLKAAIYIYDLIGFRGFFEFYLYLEHLEYKLILPTKPLWEPEKFQIEDSLDWKRTINMSKINDKQYCQQVLRDLFKEINWSLDVTNISDNDLDDYILKYY